MRPADINDRRLNTLHAAHSPIAPNALKIDSNWPARWIDLVIEWLKWPVAVLALASLPALALAWMTMLRDIASAPWSMLIFGSGCAVYGIAWWRFLRRLRFSLLLTLEHELTHVLFAWATFHRVVGLRVTARKGGHVTFVGRGNWLISLAPYFFPTSTVLLIAVFAPLSILPGAGMLGDFLVGASFSYHVTSTLRETHAGQTDLMRAGRVFSLMFLPAANVLFAGLVLAHAHNGLHGLFAFLGEVGARLLWFAPAAAGG